MSSTTTSSPSRPSPPSLGASSPSPPPQQRTAPFFLGGQSILVASPASSMAQPLKAAENGGWNAGGDDQGVAAEGRRYLRGTRQDGGFTIEKASDLSNAALCMRRSCIN
ncbi:hypothetical protein V2G26_018024 [Clonostachys chloroleuca]